jgi:hypothetical protein
VPQPLSLCWPGTRTCPSRSLKANNKSKSDQNLLWHFPVIGHSTWHPDSSTPSFSLSLSLCIQHSDPLRIALTDSPTKNAQVCVLWPHHPSYAVPRRNNALFRFLNSGSALIMVSHWNKFSSHGGRLVSSNRRDIYPCPSPSVTQVESRQLALVSVELLSLLLSPRTLTCLATWSCYVPKGRRWSHQTRRRLVMANQSSIGGYHTSYWKCGRRRSSPRVVEWREYYL